MRKLSTGEPCAGKPLARFGGRGESGKALLYPYRARDGHFLTFQVLNESGLYFKASHPCDWIRYAL